MKKNICLLAGFLGLMACADTENLDDKKLIAHSDFENLKGWGGLPETNSLTTERAHSGKYSVKVDKDIEYGFGFNQAIGKVLKAKPKVVRVDAWTYLPSNQAYSVIVMSIEDPVTRHLVFWDGIKLAEKVKNYKQWVEVSKEFTLPDSLEVTDNINLYLWSAKAPEPAYIDDLKLTVVE